MRQNSETRATPEQNVKNFRRTTRRHQSAEENIRVVLVGQLALDEPDLSPGNWLEIAGGDFQRMLSDLSSGR